MSRGSTSRRALAGVALAVLVLGAAACTDDSEGEEEATTPSEAASGDTSASAAESVGPADDSLEPVRIGYASVDQGTVGLPGSTAGATAAVEYINAELGGINGHPVELVTCSVDLDPQSNQACGQEFANDGSLTLVNAGFMFNGASFYTALGSSDLPVVGSIPLNDADFASPAWFWSAGQLIQGANVRLAQFIAPDATNIGLLSQDNATGNTSEAVLRAGLSELMPDAELRVAKVSQGSTDLVGSVGELGEPDLVFLNLGGTGCIQGLQALNDLIPEVPILTGAACTSDAVIAEVGAEAVEGAVFASTSEIVTAGEVSADAEVFLEKFPEYGDEDLLSDPFAGHQWGITMTIRQVLSELSDDELVDPSAVRDAIMNFSGPVVLGVQDLSCPGAIEAQVCADSVLGYQVVEGVSVPLEGNAVVPIG